MDKHLRETLMRFEIACKTTSLDTYPRQYLAPQWSHAARELPSVVIWDEHMPKALRSWNLASDGYWEARPMIDEIDLPDWDELHEPDSHFVYRFFDDQGELLYVEITNSFERRDGKHRTTKTWAGQISDSRTTVEYARTRTDALAREKQIIQAEHPRHNVQHNRR